MTKLAKDMRGNWTAYTTFPVEGRKGFDLTVRTVKVFSGSLVTTAEVTARDDKLGFSSHRVYVDFSKRLAITGDRCTKGNVERQHTQALESLPTLKLEVEAHYKCLDQKEAA